MFGSDFLILLLSVFFILCYFLCVFPLWRKFHKMRANKVFSAHTCPGFGKKHMLMFVGEAAVLALHVKDLNAFTGLCCWSSCFIKAMATSLLPFIFLVYYMCLVSMNN